MSISSPGRNALREYVDVVERLSVEFDGTHAAGTVSRCVAAARDGAAGVDAASPDVVEQMARDRLQLLTACVGQQPASQTRSR